MSGTGILYVVATPIGNLGDLTRRAVEVLRGVPLVAAEDTRRTRQLLHAVESEARLVSYHAHSERRREEELIGRLLGGESVALVTDAGTPGVSDPGPLLVRAARQAGITVVPVPGASAVATAVAGSGLPADRYLFLGFPPRKGRERGEWLDVVAGARWTVICFEAANRLVPLLDDLAERCGADREAVVARELTKLHEEFRADRLADLAHHYRGHPPRGEVTLLIAGRGDGDSARPSAVPSDQEIGALVDEARAAGKTDREIVRELTQAAGIPRNVAYRMVMEMKE